METAALESFDEDITHTKDLLNLKVINTNI